MQTPAAFISYAHRDDKAHDGRISELRGRLALVVGAAIGRDFEIFQDRNGIAWGQHWPSRLDEALEHALFLIPILTPSYFNSNLCRSELEKFLELERLAGRNDLILPIYFRTVRALTDGNDPLAAALVERQYRDWRGLRDYPIQSLEVRREIDHLAEDIDAAIHRTPSRVRPEGKRSTAGFVRIGDPGSELAPGTVFKDVNAPWCPEMVVIPAGSFIMGSPEDEEYRYEDEGPPHQVMFSQAFALGRYPVTFEEYDRFCAQTQRQKPRDVGWGRGRRPVINVSYEDARAYCKWLTHVTEQPYSLPSEAEWEYGCRAGTTTPFSTGETISTSQANYDGTYIYGRSMKGLYRERTTPVDAFHDNPWGLHDMHGNVWEWCEDCWNTSYEDAPGEGLAWVVGECSSRVVRGGSWDSGPWLLRSAHRGRTEVERQSFFLGFRVARKLKDLKTLGSVNIEEGCEAPDEIY